MSHVPTLLVVDDDRDARELYRLWFESRFDVRTAADGEAALEQVTADVDAVVTDREMPRRDGVSLATAIREGPYDPALVMISGVSPDASDLDIPVDTYLSKPVTREGLRDAVSTTRSWRGYRPARRDLHALAARLAAVEREQALVDLVDSETYEAALARLRDADVSPRIAGTVSTGPATRGSDSADAGRTPRASRQ